MEILLSTSRRNPRKTQKLAKELEFSGIELVMASRYDSKEKRPNWSYRGIQNVKAIHAPVDLYDHSRFKFALFDALSLADLVGAKVVNIHPPSSSSEVGGRENVIDGIHLIRTLSRKFPQVTISYEVLPLPDPKKPHQLSQKAYSSVSAWCDDVREFRLPAAINVAHVVPWGENPVFVAAELASNLRHVHLSDYGGDKEQRLFPGEGDVDWKVFFKLLRNLNNQDIYITLEPPRRFDIFGKDKHRLIKSLTFIRKHLNA